MAHTSRFVLGTAQLGQRYGVANTSGQPTTDEAARMIGTAWRAGVRFFDTAQGYGAGESVLGDSLAAIGADLNEARVVSKIAKMDFADPRAIGRTVGESVDRLHVPALWGLLLHDEECLDAWNANVSSALELVRECKLARHVGVSVYSPDRALQALSSPGLDLVQIPANIFDRRFARADVGKRAAEAGKRLFIRSIYLQGLALMRPSSVPNYVSRAREAVEMLHRFCADIELKPAEFAWRYVMFRFPHAAIIVGCETQAQLAENLRLCTLGPVESAIAEEWDDLWPNDVVELIDPRGWSQAAAIHGP